MVKTPPAPIARSFRNRRRRLALVVTGVYLLLSVAWIILSDRVAYLFVDSASELARLQTFKGILFVLLSALVIYVLIERGVRRQSAVEQALQDREAQLSELIGNLPGIVYQCRYDGDWTMRFLGGAVHEITGYDRAELIDNRRLSYNDVVLETDRAGLRRMVDKAVGAGQPFIAEYRIRHKNGGLRWIYEQGRAVCTPDGRVDYLEGFLQDVTGRYASRQALDECEERFSLLAEAVTDGAFMSLDERGCIAGWNAGAYRLTGYGEADVIGRPLALLYDNDATGAELALQQARAKGVWHGHGRLFAGNGQHFAARLTLTALWAEDGSLRGYGLFARASGQSVVD